MLADFQWVIVVASRFSINKQGVQDFGILLRYKMKIPNARPLEKGGMALLLQLPKRQLQVIFFFFFFFGFIFIQTWPLLRWRQTSGLNFIDTFTHRTEETYVVESRVLQDFLHFCICFVLLLNAWLWSSMPSYLVSFINMLNYSIFKDFVFIDLSYLYVHLLLSTMAYEQSADVQTLKEV